MDIGVKFAIAAGVALGTSALIVVPSKKQKEAAALDLFDKSFEECTPQETKVAEFKAGHKRWTGFFESSVYPLTRKLPGASNPIVNPYKDAEPAGGGMEDEE